MTSPNRVRAAFYGDDFTGSTDALLQFHRFGLRSTLFLSSPTEASLSAAAQEYEVIGVAGIARSLPSASIEAEVRPIFERFAGLGCELVQYKICSTFDSSPETGSFAPAISLAREIFGAVALPVLPAQPEFGRYTIFANHFARAGHETYRLDRHPTMSRHPSTPIDEADLCRFLERQIGGSVAVFDLVTLRSGDEKTLLTHLAQLRSGRPAAIVFDAVENDDLIRVAKLLRRDAAQQRAANGASSSHMPIVAFGSGGLGYGFGAAFTAETPRHPAPARLPAVEKLLVVSGSCAPQTAEQIRWALEHGWRGVHVDPFTWIEEARRGHDESVNAATAEAIKALSESDRGVVVFSALGPQDRARTSKAATSEHRDDSAPLNGASMASVLGSGLGRIVRQVLEMTKVRRVVISGGDTSGYATRALGAESLEIIVPLVAAGAVCRLSALNHPCVDGAEVMLKGGQVGNRDLFEVVRTANASVAGER